MKVDTTHSLVTMLIEVDGEVCVVMMDQDKLDAVSFMVKKSTNKLVKTGKTQTELNKYLLPAFFKE